MKDKALIDWSIPVPFTRYEMTLGQWGLVIALLFIASRELLADSYAMAVLLLVCNAIQIILFIQRRDADVEGKLRSD